MHGISNLKTAGRRLSKIKLGLISTGLVLAVLFGGWVVAQEFAWYCHPYGSINYRGETAMDNSKVSAFINGVEIVTGLTQNGQYDLLIPKDDPSTSKKEGWTENDTITIKIDGFTTVPSFAAFSGTKKIDLFLPSLDVKLTTWGKIKALFK